VRGYSSSDSLSCLASLSRLAGTDALAVRRLDVQLVAQSALSSSAQQYYLQHSLCNDDPSTTPLVWSKTASAFTLRTRACTTALNSVRSYVSRLYFVASCNRCGTGGDTVPTLKRLDLQGNNLVETALVEGVETFRLEYGFDTDNNGSPDTYRTTLGSGAAGLWENVVAINVHMIVRSTDAVTGASLARAQTFQLGGIGTVSTANDGFSRRAYSSTVRLINPSGVREAQ
jgi:type IV pilus assembly protein PilW